MQKRILSLALIVAFAIPLCAQAPQSTSIFLDAIKSEAAAEMKAQQLPSISVAILQPGHDVEAFALGYADIDKKVPATPESLYRIASISKPITAVAIMELAQEHKLDLDRSAQQYCPAFKGHPEVTARELLSHRSGVAHYKGPATEFNTVHYKSLDDAVKSFASEPLLFPAGQGFQYSSYGFTVLGCEIEGATREGYAAFVHEHVLTLSQMSHTVVDDARAAIPNRVQFYSLQRNKLIAAPPLDTSDRLPGGGWLSTPSDMVRFANHVTTLLGDEWTHQMWTETTHSGDPMHYGLGWGLTSTAGHVVVEHAGGQSGTSTSLAAVPDLGLAVAVFTNRNGAEISKVSAHMLEELLRKAASTPKQ